MLKVERLGLHNVDMEPDVKPSTVSFVQCNASEHLLDAPFLLI